MIELMVKKHTKTSRKKISDGLKLAYKKGVRKNRQPMLGYKHTQKTKEKMRQSALKRISKNPNTLPDNTGRFKDNPGYNALHAWLKKQYGKASLCENCQSINDVQWANKTGKYLRKRNDWRQLCRTCHRKYDKEFQIWTHPRFD